MGCSDRGAIDDDELVEITQDHPAAQKAPQRTPTKTRRASRRRRVIGRLQRGRWSPSAGTPLGMRGLILQIGPPGK
ncbi:MAG: hypothetical protein ACREVY_09610 [Gammaproteobacteria bacterium]